MPPANLPQKLICLLSHFYDRQDRSFVNRSRKPFSYKASLAYHPQSTLIYSNARSNVSKVKLVDRFVGVVVLLEENRYYCPILKSAKKILLCSRFVLCRYLSQKSRQNAVLPARR